MSLMYLDTVEFVVAGIFITVHPRVFDVVLFPCNANIDALQDVQSLSTYTLRLRDSETWSETDFRH